MLPELQEEAQMSDIEWADMFEDEDDDDDE